MVVPEILVFAVQGLVWVPLVLGAAFLYRRSAAGKRAMSAAQLVAIAFGIDAGLLGIEHGLFEALQGTATPSGSLITAIGPPCQAATAWRGCEPAFTLIPNFLITGIVAILLALVLLMVAAVFTNRRHVGLMMALLTLALFLTGGGITTLLFGLLGGLAATRINGPLRWWRTRMPAALVRVVSGPWPWLLAAYMAWASLSWTIPAYSNDLMLQLTPIVTIVTPLVILVMPLVGVAHDSRTKNGERAPNVG